MKSKPTVYLISSQLDARRAVYQATTSLDCRVETFGSAEQFLSRECSPSWIHARLPRPACLVVELDLPGMDGLELQSRLCQQHSCLPMIFTAAPRSVDSAVLATKRGALDFLEKPVQAQRLARTIQTAWTVDQQRRDEFDRNRETVRRMQALTLRERQVLERLLDHQPPKRIAALLGTSPHTVRNQRASILRKMGAQDNAELASMVLMTTCVGVADAEPHGPLL